VRSAFVFGEVGRVESVEVAVVEVVGGDGIECRDQGSDVLLGCVRTEPPEGLAQLVADGVRAVGFGELLGATFGCPVGGVVPLLALGVADSRRGSPFLES
jgi:hypothetical protein